VSGVNVIWRRISARSDSDLQISSEVDLDEFVSAVVERSSDVNIEGLVL